MCLCIIYTQAVDVLGRTSKSWASLFPPLPKPKCEAFSLSPYSLFSLRGSWEVPPTAPHCSDLVEGSLPTSLSSSLSLAEDQTKRPLVCGFSFRGPSHQSCSFGGGTVPPGANLEKTQPPVGTQPHVSHVRAVLPAVSLAVGAPPALISSPAWVFLCFQPGTSSPWQPLCPSWPCTPPFCGAIPLLWSGPCLHP